MPHESNADDVAVGRVWRHKRQRFRRVQITHVMDGEPARVYVSRNTSRRTQSIKVSTLVREYVPE